MVRTRVVQGSAPASSGAKPRGSALATVFAWAMVISGTVAWSTYGPPEAVPFQGQYAPNYPARVFKIILLAGALIMVIRRWNAMRALLRELNPGYMVFLALAAASYVWSVSPPNTLSRVVGTVQMVAIWAAVCVTGTDSRRFQESARPIMTVLIVGSIIFAMTYPELAIEKGEGTLKESWRGLTSQKNAFGQLSSFGFIFWFHAWLAREVKTWKALLFGGCSFACILFSRSSTSLFATLFASFFLLILLRSPRSLRRTMPYIVGTFAGVVITYAVAVLRIVPGLSLILEPVTSITGKDMTFSNRSIIWDIIKEHIQYAPYLGSGYGAYWIGPDPSSPSYEFLARMYFYPNESHNGYLEIVNDLGFVGLIVLFAYLMQYVRQAVRLIPFDRNQAGLYLAVFFQQAVINLSESCWLDTNSGFSYMLTTFATIALAQSAVDQRNQRVIQGRAR
jgi:O-antigen ligase